MQIGAARYHIDIGRFLFDNLLEKYFFYIDNCIYKCHILNIKRERREKKMNKSNQIQIKLTQQLRKYYPNITIQVKAQDNSGLYRIWIKELKNGTPDVTDVMQQCFPEAEPFTGLGYENGGYCQSFLIY